MANKEKNVLPNDDFDMDGGFEDFDFDDPTVKDDRTPIIKAAYGVLDGATSELTGEGFIRDSLKTVFPSAYGEALDLADEVHGSIKNLYEESAAKIKPTLRMTRNTLLKVIPADSKHMPKRLQSVIDSWKAQKEEERQDIATPTAGREAVLSSTLNDMFQAQMQTDHENRIISDGRENLQAGVDQVRYKNTLDAANRSAISLNRLENYQTTIGLNFQKKSLEVSYRQLFAIQDSLTYAKEDAVKRDALLMAISKNSSLPEFVKIKDSENKKQIFKNKLYESVSNGLYGNRNRFVEKTLSGISKKVTSSLGEFAEGIQGGLSMADMAVGVSDGLDITTVGGQIGGQFGAEYLGGKAAKWAKDKLTNSKLDKKLGISDKGHKLSGILDSVPNKLNEFRKNNKYAYDDSIKAGVIGFIQSVIPTFGVDTATVQPKGAEMDSPFHFTKRTDKSINEVIPGLLARIFRELQVTRTGNESLELMVFDHDADGFVSEEKLAQTIKGRVAPNEAILRINRDLDAILLQLDPTNKALDADAKAALKKKLLSNSADRNEASVARLGAHSGYRDTKDGVSDQIVPLIKEFLNNASSKEKELFHMRHNALADNVQDPRQYIQQQLDLGNGERLRKLGLIDPKTGSILDSKIQEMYLDTTNLPISKSPPGSAEQTDAVAEKQSSVAFQQMTKKLRTDSSLKWAMSKAKSAVVGDAPAFTMASRDNPDAPRMNQDSVNGLSSFFGGRPIPASNQEESVPDQTASSVDASPPPPPTQPLPQSLAQNMPSGPVVSAGAMQGLSAFFTAPRTNLGDHVSATKAQMLALPPLNAIARIAANITDYATSVTQKTLDHPIAQLGYNKANSALALASPHTQKAKTAIFAPVASILEKATGSISNKLPTLDQIKTGIADLYVRGRSSAAITGAQIEAGELFDKATGKVIKSVADIRGTVVNKHAQVMITIGELKQLTYLDAKTKTLQNAAKLNARFSTISSQVVTKLKPFSLRAASILPIIRQAKDGVVDLYLQGRSDPVITGAQIEAGELFDKATGKVIKSVADIRGTVVNASGAAQVKIDEIAKLTYFDIASRTYLRASKLSSQLGNLATQTTQNAKLSLGTAYAAASKTFKDTFAAETNEPNDVYVEGDVDQTTPRLTSIGFKNGDYVDGDTGKTLRTEKDITGSVKANGTVVLAQGDLKKLKIFDSKTRTWGLLNLSKAVVSGLWHFQTKVAPGMAARNLGRVYRVIKSVLGLGSQRKALEQPKDVYIRGSKTPVLIGYKFLQNEYRDLETKKILFSQKDIEGPVIDSTGAVIVSESDLDKLYTLDSFFSKYNPLKLLKWLVKAPFRLALGATKLGAKAAGVGLGLLKRGAVGAVGIGNKALVGLGLKMGPQDLYVAGVKAPVLTGIDMRAGKYFSSRTGKTILTPGDIDGDIKDASGQIVLTTSQITQGLATYAGRPVRVKLGLLTSLASGARLIGRGLKAVFNPKVKTSLAIKKTKNIKGPPTTAETATIKSSTTLDKILEKMSSFTKKDSGVRKGSLADGVATTTIAKEKASKVKGGDQDKKSPKSLAGKVPEPAEVGSMLGDALKVAAGSLLSTTGITAAASTAAATAGATLMTGLAALGTGLVAFVSSPVVLSAAAVALTAYAGYKGYQYLTRGSLSNLEQLRMVQYGFAGNDTENIRRIVDLESYLSGHMKPGPAGFELQYTKLDAGKLLGFFGLSVTKEAHRTLFFDWFQNRFKAVFLTHITSLYALTQKTDLSSVSGLKSEDKKKYLEAITFPEGPYGFGGLPLADSKLVATNSNAVDIATKEAVGECNRLKVGEKTPADIANSARPIEEPKPIIKPPANLETEVPAKQRTTIPKPVPVTPPDTEQAPSGSAQALANSAAPMPGGGSSSGIMLASGTTYDGRNAQGYLALGTNAKVDQVNPSMKDQFNGMVEEYGSITGKKTPVTQAFRSYDDQAEMKRKFGPKAAAPGSSLHEYGLAMDADSKTMDKMDEMGLMRKYGLTRPVGAEPWHVEPIGIQGDIAGAKKDPNAAAKAVVAGLGLGGGGIGTVVGAKPYSRNSKDSEAIMGASPKTVDPSDIVKPTSLATAVAQEPIKPSSVATPKTLQKAFTSQPDTETKPPAAVSLLTAAPAIAPTLAGQVGASVNSTAAMPASPTTKVPEPSGPGLAGVKDTITAAATMVGVDPNEQLASAAMESGFNANAKASNTSASGLFQFVNATWKEVISKYGRKYGYGADTPPTDAKAASIMAAHYSKDTKASLQKNANQPVGATEGYLAHFLGAGGAAKFLNGMQTNPSGPAATAMPEAAAANKSIFYDQNGPRSFSDVYALLQKRIIDKASSYGISLPKGAPVSAGGVSSKVTQLAGGVGVADTSQPVSARAKPTAAPVTPAVPATPNPPSTDMASAYGFNAPSASMPALPSPTAGFDRSILNATEGLLTKQLEVQTKMLEVMTKMFGLASSKVTEGPLAGKAVSPGAPPATSNAGKPSELPNAYEVPKAPVSMKRIRQT